MDMITLAMAKAYADKKGGYEDSYSLEWDGNYDNKEVVLYMPEAGFYKVSNRVFSKDELLGATLEDINGTWVMTDETIADLSSETGVPSCVCFGGNQICVFSGKACTIMYEGTPLTVPSDGTYFGESPKIEEMYKKPVVSSLSNETIVPIDQKYLPGVCLPVVELTTVPTEEGAALTADEVAKIIEVFVPGMPIIATVPLFDGMTVGVVMSGMVEDGVPLLGGQIMIANAEYRYNVMQTNDDVLFTVTAVND